MIIHLLYALLAQPIIPASGISNTIHNNH